MARSTQKGALAQNRPQKKTRRNRNRRGNVKSSTDQRPTVHLSQCAADYAKAKCAPFAYAGNLNPCIPDLLDLPSQKFSTLLRGEATVGIDGVGFVLVAPAANCSDKNMIWSTNQLFSGTAVPGGLPTTGVLGTPNLQYPWAVSQARNARTVACGLRLRYTGTELKRGGRLFLVQNKSAIGGFVGNSPSQILLEPEAQSYPVTREWKTISWNPGYPEAFEYSADTYPLDTSLPYNGHLLAMFSGEAGNTFEYEVITYHEAVSKGPGAPVQNVTKSHSDPVGFALVKDFLAQSADNVFSSGSNNGLGGYKEFLTFAAKGAAAAASTYFTGSPSAGMLALPWR